MAEHFSVSLKAQFPQLDESNCRHTSEKTPRYNCIAWAASDDTRFWWPSGPGQPAYWPSGIPRQVTLQAFILAFQQLGYAVTSSSTWCPEHDRIAIYTLHDIPTHAARQLSAAEWTSKLGPYIDISHTTPQAIEGPAYGVVAVYMERHRSRRPALAI
jgi:hypothetical protein